MTSQCSAYYFFFNDTATTEIYTFSLHDALPISGADPPVTGSEPGPLLVGAGVAVPDLQGGAVGGAAAGHVQAPAGRDRKSTRLNSSHANISYAVFCLKKKTKLLSF